jgi:hypothetical protein
LFTRKNNFWVSFKLIKFGLNSHKVHSFRVIAILGFSQNMVTVNIGMLHYVIDHIYGAFMHRTKISPPFFSRGWGGSKLELLERMIKDLFPEVEGQNWPPSLIQPIWRTVWETRSACLREGVFRTSCDEQLISALPPESHTARVAFLAPKHVPPQKMACVVHLAGKTVYL